jgi:hypothetical protein
VSTQVAFSNIMSSVICLHSIKVCGMHHYGYSSLPRDVVYDLHRELNNRFDNNAVAVKDGNRIIAHVIKEDASKLATLFDRGLIQSMTIKLAYDAEVRTYRQGPQQTGTVWLTYKSELKEKLTSVIKDAKLATE